jgi:glycosyltransferase involved in cell wall biosynthesis
MKILHIVEDYSLLSGGLRTVIKDLDLEILSNNFISKILSSSKENEDEIYLVDSKKPWLYSNKWIPKLKELHFKYNFDVIHIHGVWMYPQYVAAKFCIKNKIPFIISVHGMYEPWLWKKGTLKKKLYFNLLVKNVFKKATFIHAITPNEKNNLQKIFKKNTIIEIPNLIKKINIKDKYTSSYKDKYILYIGRLDEKKGIDTLIIAFNELSDKKVKLKIAGEINDYKKELDFLIKEFGIEKRVDFLGLVKNNNKEILIKDAFVLVAPSHSEVIGMVNLEGAIYKVPVITTYQTGINKKWSENGGRLINPNKEELINALKEVLKWSNKERELNGQKLHNFVLNNYSWDKRFLDWIKLYQSAKNT